MLDLAIIILNYNSPELTVECLDSLSEQVKSKPFHVVVVDNGSKDESIAMLQAYVEEKDWCTLVESKKNLGFAGGNNIGIKNVLAKNYLLLNNDTIAKKNAIEILNDYANKNPNLGIISCHLEGPNGEIQTKKFRFHSPLGELITQANIGFIYKIFKSSQVPIFDHESDPAQWVCFAAVLIRSNVFDKIGLLDESYFVYYEDVDFCLKARKAKIEIGVCEDAKIVHKISASTKTFLGPDDKIKRRPAYFYKARNLFYRKHYTAGYLLANIGWTVGRTISLLAQPFRTNKAQERYEKDFLDIWKI